MMLKRLLLIVLLATMLSPLTACGRKNDVEPPPGSNYPHDYPRS